MKIIIAFLLLILFGNELSAQSVGIGTNTPNPKAALEVNSTSKGVLIPSMTSSQRIAITTPPNGLMVYDTDKNEFYHYNGTGWRAILNGDYWSRPITARDRISNVNDSIGIGTIAPAAKFHVNGDVKITDGTQGDGKILTSDANGLASWQNSAYLKNERVMIKFSSAADDSTITFPQVLYVNGSAITYRVFTKDFLINKSGFYHFGGVFASPFNLSGEDYDNFAAFIEFDNNLLSIGSLDRYVFLPLTGILGRRGGPFGIDIYLNAGTSVSIKISQWPPHPGQATSRFSFISAYLISD